VTIVIPSNSVRNTSEKKRENKQKWSNETGKKRVSV
jgi:hypothetical protein